MEKFDEVQLAPRATSPEVTPKQVMVPSAIRSDILSVTQELTDEEIAILSSLRVLRAIAEQPSVNAAEQAVLVGASYTFQSLADACKKIAERLDKAANHQAGQAQHRKRTGSSQKELPPN